MGHHSSEEMSAEMLAAFEHAKREKVIDETLMKAKDPTFGATGRYPMGEIDKTDEGEIIFDVASHRGKVIINFGKPVSWLGLDARQCAMLAQLLIQHATRCRDIGEEQKSKATAKEHAT